MKNCLRSALALAAALPTTLALAASFGGIEVPPPPPARPVTETFHGTTVVSPFRWMEDLKDPEVQSWMKAQNDATEAIFARIPGRDTMLARIKEIEGKAAGLTSDAVRTANGRYFFLQREPADNQFKLVWRERADGPDRLIVDPEALAKSTGKPHAVMDFAPSPDGRRVAYALQVGGGEIGTLHVLDLSSGKEVIEPVDRIRYASVAWLPDSSGFFYARLRENFESYPVDERFDDHATHFRLVADPASDRKVFSALRDGKLTLPATRTGSSSRSPAAASPRTTCSSASSASACSTSARSTQRSAVRPRGSRC